MASSALPHALVAAAVGAAIEYPLSQRFPTVPSTGTLPRMAIAGALVFVAVLAANALTRR
jgi:hypothetical protein